jgi:hypothetical protein
MPTAGRKAIQEAMKPQCGEKGDFGYSNLWGSPYLCFDTVCNLKRGHKDKHQAEVQMRICPSFEAKGLNVERGSLEYPKTFTMKWLNKEA